jgi:hypothetical protein
VLPFNKRRGSEIEIQPDEVEPVQLPPVRPPSVRPAAGVAPSRSTSSFPPAGMSGGHRLPPPSPPSVRPSAPPARPSARPPISFRPPADDNERTLFVAEKQPRRTLDLRQPKVPNFDEPSVMVSSTRDSFSDDEATRIHPNSSRSVLSMSAAAMPSSRRLLDDSSGRIRSDVPPPPPPSSVRVEEPRSAAAVDMSMTVGAAASQSQQVTSRSKVASGGRPTAVWAAALVAVGVFTGLAAALVARGGSDSMVTASAALIDPAQGNGPQILAQPQGAVANVAPVATTANVQGAAAQPQVAQVVSQALQPAASCAADVTPTVKAADTKVAAAPVVVADTKAVEPKVDAHVATVAPPPAAKPVVAATPKPPVAAQPKVVAAAPPPAPKPAAAPAAKPAVKGSDADSAAAADALAKAQLEAALGR